MAQKLAGRPRLDVDREMLVRCAKAGLSQRATASMLGCSPAYLSGLKDVDTEVNQLFERAKAESHLQLVETLTEQALGGNMIAAFFLLKSVHGLRDSGVVPEQEVPSRQSQIRLYLPENSR